MNRVFFVLLGLFLSLGCLAQTKLPPCKNNTSYWTDCFGVVELGLTTARGDAWPTPRTSKHPAMTET